MRRANRFLDAVMSLLSPLEYDAPDPAVTLPLVDISKWQTNVNYTACVSGGWDTAILKASEGYGADPLFETHWQGFRAAGALVMVYHFFRSNLDGKQQAQACLDTCAPLITESGRIAIFADVETADNTPNNTRAQRLRDFLTTIESDGQVAGVYCSPSLWQSLLVGTQAASWINNYWQWVAHWTAASLPLLPLAWTWDKTVLWQYGISPTHNWTSRPPGFPGSVDVDKAFVSSRDELCLRLGLPLPGTVPPPVPPGNTLIAPALTGARVIAPRGVNVREQPATTSPIRGTYASGTILEVAKIAFPKPGEEWAWVYHPASNLYGWSAVVYGGQVYMENYPIL